MGFFIIILTVFIVVNALLLILLVLMQLPKKEAGAGLAFGGAATDALFGAGSGNILTKATKYAATAFFVLAVVIGILQRNSYLHSGNEFQRNAEQQSQRGSVVAPPPAATTEPVTTPAEASDSGGHNLLVPSGTNATAPK